MSDDAVGTTFVCEICSKEITKDQEYYHDDHGVRWHKECGHISGYARCQGTDW